VVDKFGVVVGSDGKVYKMNPSNSEYDQEVTGLVTDEELTDALAGKAPVFTGLTGTRTIQGHTLTFTNGILTGYQAP